MRRGASHIVTRTPLRLLDALSRPAWIPTGVEELDLSLAAGPYQYFDTEVAERPNGFPDTHGWCWPPRLSILTRRGGAVGETNRLRGGLR